MMRYLTAFPHSWLRQAIGAHDGTYEGCLAAIWQ